MSRGGRPGRGRYVAALLSIAALLSLVLVIVIRGPAADPLDLEANPHFDPTLPLQERVDHVLERMNLDEKVAQLRGLRRMQTPHNRRLGIPDFRPTDGPHGVNRKGGWLWERKGVVARFDPERAWAAFPGPSVTTQRRTLACRALPSGSRCDTRSWPLSSAPCCCSPSGRLRAVTCIGRTRSQREPAVGNPTPSATLVVRPHESSEEPLLAAPTVRPWVPQTPQSDEEGSQSGRPLYRPTRPDRRPTCGHRPRLP